MSLPPFNFGTVFLLFAVWTLVAVLFGLLIGKTMHHADDDERTEPDDVDLWEAELESARLRHPSGREWWA